MALNFFVKSIKRFVFKNLKAKKIEFQRNFRLQLFRVSEMIKNGVID